VCCLDEGQKSDALGEHCVPSVTWVVVVAEFHLDAGACAGALW